MNYHAVDTPHITISEIILTDLKKIEGIRIGLQIKSGFNGEVIGVHIHAESSIRKAAHTFPMMQAWCKAKGFKLCDRYPCTSSMQIFFN